MAKITLHIEADASAVSTALVNLKKEAQSLSGLKIDLGIDAKTATAVAKAASAMASLQRAQAQQATAQSKVQVAVQKTIQAHEKTEQALEKTHQAQEKTTQSANRLATAQQRTYQAEERTTQAFERTYQAQERTAQAQERTTQTANQLASQQERTAQSANRLGIEQERTARAMLNGGRAAESASTGYDAVAVAIGNIAARAVHAVINKATQAFKEALTTMKSVDSELANIQKVTDESDAVIAKLGDTAYDTASKYGVAANDFLSASADFAKAGYDNYSAMAELATKTQLVGDVSADVASKFLLSADAAFKFGGNIDSLSTVLDKANIIENNYATSIEKLADGFPVVANTAAMANMSIDETMAAIGTITAVTQESGTMAARALRALILNILKDTTTEVEDGVTVTKDQIKSLQDALNKYAPDVVKAAEATGKIIDPMEAIGALSKAWEEGLLSEQELAAMVTDIGGKLRANQLLALIKNFDMFNKMLDKSKNSAGSADKEIGIMLDTWEAKTNQLKNSWTKLVSDLVDTKIVKGGIDALTLAIEAADDLFERSQNAAKGVEDIRNAITSAKDEIARLELKSAAEGLTAIEERRLEVLQAQLAVMEAQERKEAEKAIGQIDSKYGFSMTLPSGETGNEAYLAGLRGGATSARTDWNATADVDAYKNALQGLVEKYAEVYNAYQQIISLGGELNQTQLDFMSDYEAVAQASLATAEQINDVQTESFELTRDNEGIAAFWRLDENVIEQIDNAAEIQKEAEEAALAAAAARQEELNNQNQNTREWADYQAEMAQAMADYDASIADVTSSEDGAADSASDIAENVDNIDFSDANDGASRLLSLLKAVSLIQFNPFGGGFGFASGTTNAPGGPTLVNELGPELISENGRAYIANGGRPGIVNLSKGAIVLPASVTRDALRGGGAQKEIHAAAGETGNVRGSSSWLKGLLGSSGASGRTTPTVVITPNGVYSNGSNIANINPVSAGTSTGNDKTDKPKGSGSGGAAATAAAAKSIEDYAKETKDVLSNLEKQAKLADNRGQYSKEADLYKKAQSEIDKMVARYKKAGYKETDDEILDLLNKRYDYDKKIDTANQKGIKEAADELKDKLSNLDKQAKLANTEGDYTKEVQFYEQAQELIAEMVDRYRKAGYADDSDEIVDLLQKNYDYGDKQVKVYSDRWKDLINALDADTEAQEVATKLAEKQQALEDARLALENATKNRTVRMYNAATGQWEWVADQSKVNQAKENLTKAESDYSDSLKESAVSELENLAANNTSLEDAILGPALSAIMMKAESSPEFQNFARALNAVYGVGSYLNSTEGSSKVISTASDSHDTIYTFGNVTLTEAEAQSMSVAELAQKLQVLKIS